MTQEFTYNAFGTQNCIIGLRSKRIFVFSGQIDMPKPFLKSDWVSLKDISSRHHISVRTLENWIAKGKIAAKRFGPGRGVYFVRLSDFAKFAQPKRGAPAGNKNAQKKSRSINLRFDKVNSFKRLSLGFTVNPIT